MKPDQGPTTSRRLYSVLECPENTVRLCTTIPDFGSALFEFTDFSICSHFERLQLYLPPMSSLSFTPLPSAVPLKIVDRLLLATSNFLYRDNANHPIAFRILSELRHLHPNPSSPIAGPTYVPYHGTEGIKPDWERRFELLKGRAGYGERLNTLDLAWAYHLGEGTQVHNVSADFYSREVWDKEIYLIEEQKEKAGLGIAKILFQRYLDRGSQVSKKEKGEVVGIYEKFGEIGQRTF